MIVIVGYNRIKANEISDLLNSMNIENKISSNELDILKSDQIILPDSDGLGKIIRKCQLLNLYSVLKMLDKPILGIKLGGLIMHYYLPQSDLKGLGIFNINEDSLVSIPIDEKYILKSKEIPELDNIYAKIQSEFSIKENKYTCCEYKSSDETFSAALKNGKNYSLNFMPDENFSEFLILFAGSN